MIYRVQISEDGDSLRDPREIGGYSRENHHCDQRQVLVSLNCTGCQVKLYGLQNQLLRRLPLPDVL